MSHAEDAELTRQLDAIMAAKARAQRISWAWFGLALAAILLAFLAPHRPWLLLAEAALLAAALWRGGRAHLRADALRNQAMEKILAEALRRERQKETP
ncbi:MAG TPA: hypothetical protein VF804_01515 [Holophagaceae bacterium]